MIHFLLGAYISGAGFTYWMSLDRFSMERPPWWQSHGAALSIALVWPVPAAIAGVMNLWEWWTRE